jgi:hypothetical protein
MICCALIVAALTGFPPPSLELTGRFNLRDIPESSGIVKSQKHPGIFWVHNDSGNPPVLFAVRLDAAIVSSFRLAVPNLDWEDMTLDDKGRLYIGDIGNNTGMLRVRAIYQFDEPDPSKPSTTPLVPSASFFFALPPGNRFDAESLIHDRGLATLIVKSRDGTDPQMFTLDLDKPAPLSRPAPLTAAGRLPSFPEPATGAALSEDGQLLAVCSTSATRIYHRGTTIAWELISEVHYPPMEAEGVTWDHNDLILAVEQTGLYRMRERTWRDAPRVTAQPSKQPAAPKRRGSKAAAIREDQ